MRLEILTLNTKPDGEDGPGEARDVTLYHEKTVQIIGGSGTHDIEVSLNGVKFETVHSGVGEGFYSVTQAVKYLRVNSTGNTDAPVVLLGGYLITDG